MIANDSFSFFFILFHFFHSFLSFIFIIFLFFSLLSKTHHSRFWGRQLFFILTSVKDKKQVGPDQVPRKRKLTRRTFYSPISFPRLIHLFFLPFSLFQLLLFHVPPFSTWNSTSNPESTTHIVDHHSSIFR